MVDHSMNSFINVRIRFIGYDLGFGVAPQGVHDIELRTRGWQPAHLDTEPLGQTLAAAGCVRTMPINEQHDVPSAPVRSHLVQHVLEIVAAKAWCDMRDARACKQADHARQHALGMAAHDRHDGLLTDWRPSAVERRDFANDC